MHVFEPFLSGAPSAYFGAPRVHREHRLKSAALYRAGWPIFVQLLQWILIIFPKKIIIGKMLTKSDIHITPRNYGNLDVTIANWLLV